MVPAHYRKHRADLALHRTFCARQRVRRGSLPGEEGLPQLRQPRECRGLVGEAVGHQAEKGTVESAERVLVELVREFEEVRGDFRGSRAEAVTWIACRGPFCEVREAVLHSFAETPGCGDVVAIRPEHAV